MNELIKAMLDNHTLSDVLYTLAETDSAKEFPEISHALKDLSFRLEELEQTEGTEEI